jgi:hypothetical protein
LHWKSLAVELSYTSPYVGDGVRDGKCIENQPKNELAVARNYLAPYISIFTDLSKLFLI